MPSTQNASENIFLIKPVKGWVSLDLRELWEYRDLIWFLAWRDILVQYKQTLFGIAWALVKPISQVLVFSLIFGKVAKLSSSGLPYAPFTLCGIIAWGFCAGSLDSSTRSVVGNANLITKVYFPRFAIPISALGRSSVDFLLSFLILIGMLFWYRILPNSQIIFFPLFLFMELAITLGFGFIFSAVSVKYRDLTHALPFMVQIWFWITPVAYGIENIPKNIIWLFYINPMTWVVQGFRWTILGVGDMDILNIAVPLLLSLLIFFFGLFFFKRMEIQFADII